MRQLIPKGTKQRLKRPNTELKVTIWVTSEIRPSRRLGGKLKVTIRVTSETKPKDKPNVTIRVTSERMPRRRPSGKLKVTIRVTSGKERQKKVDSKLWEEAKTIGKNRLGFGHFS